MKEFTCVVKLEFGGNNFKAKSEKNYKKKVIDSFHDKFGITLENYEIQEIKEGK